jgi:branched-subunit amino acid transport protein
MIEPAVGIAVVAASILAVRVFPFALARRIVLPPLAREALELAAPAIIAALLAMGLVFDRQTGAVDLSPGNDYLVGGLLTVAIAFWLRNFTLGTILGFAAFSAIRLLH